jgi:hypothetical protein
VHHEVHPVDDPQIKSPEGSSQASVYSEPADERIEEDHGDAVPVDETPPPPPLRSVPHPPPRHTEEDLEDAGAGHPTSLKVEPQDLERDVPEPRGLEVNELPPAALEKEQDDDNDNEEIEVEEREPPAPPPRLPHAHSSLADVVGQSRANRVDEPAGEQDEEEPVDDEAYPVEEPAGEQDEEELEEDGAEAPPPPPPRSAHAHPSLAKVVQQAHGSHTEQPTSDDDAQAEEQLIAEPEELDESSAPPALPGGRHTAPPRESLEQDVGDEEEDPREVEDDVAPPPLPSGRRGSSSDAPIAPSVQARRPSAVITEPTAEHEIIDDDEGGKRGSHVS